MTSAIRKFVLVCLLAILAAPSASALAQECDPNAVAVATTPAPPGSADSYGKYMASREGASADVDVVVLGDSIAEGWPTGKVEALFPDSKVLNLGVGGDRTQHLLWRMMKFGEFRMAPSEVIVIIGTNNLAQTDGACAILPGIDRILAVARDMWPAAHLTVFGIMPRGEAYKFKNEERVRINGTLRLSLADWPETDFITADDTLTCNQIGSASAFVGDVEPQCTYYNRDKLHLTWEGYDLLGRLINSMRGPR